MHVFPRYHGDSFRIDADWRLWDRTELDTAAARLQAGLQAVEAQPDQPAKPDAINS
jgi:histidine triad (HIT) family protein